MTQQWQPHCRNSTRSAPRRAGVAPSGHRHVVAPAAGCAPIDSSPECRRRSSSWLSVSPRSMHRRARLEDGVLRHGLRGNGRTAAHPPAPQRWRLPTPPQRGAASRSSPRRGPGSAVPPAATANASNVRSSGEHRRHWVGPLHLRQLASRRPTPPPRIVSRHRHGARCHQLLRAPRRLPCAMQVASCRRSTRPTAGCFPSPRNGRPFCEALLGSKLTAMPGNPFTDPNWAADLADTIDRYCRKVAHRH